MCIMQDVGQLARASGPKRVSECAQWASARACVVHMRVVHMRAPSLRGCSSRAARRCADERFEGI